MMSVDSWDNPHDLVHVDDHHDLVQIPRNAEAECMLMVGDHLVIRNLYRRIHRTRLRSAISCERVIKGKRRYPRSLATRNYEPPEHALYTAVVSQMPLLDLFGLARG
jgi:hypothetical protein